MANRKLEAHHKSSQKIGMMLVMWSRRYVIKEGGQDGRCERCKTSTKLYVFKFFVSKSIGEHNQH